ncbi:DUF2281 domain-containing protein [Segetibacter aerophilus]|uniref:DUF2281 domain-containing protein n=1 Tax=Segetibacter aerophilus TaxID=670293 RepID=A0A512BCU3_9BACT|nr:DUF2281 domain-containing protein [Segetibacter aerophilus]GEO09758.1 hypothetical protein SAE01_22540 [Segetibacter aerophilus]
MSKEAIIQKTVKALNLLPEDKAEEILDFADFLLKKYEEQILQKGIQKLQAEGEVFNFLNEDEELYSSADVKQKL